MTNTVHKITPSLLAGQIEVALIGCGGNGSQMLSGLARLDRAMRSVGHPGGLQVTTYDPDVVSEANVGRQLFALQDVGQAKAALLTHRINQYYGLAWKAVTARFNLEAQGSRRTQIVISCVDSAKSRRDILTSFIDHYRPDYWLDLGNRQSDGQVILGQPPFRSSIGTASPQSFGDATEFANSVKPLPRLPLVTELFPDLLDESLPEDDRPSCSLAEALETQDLFINDHVSKWALHLLWTLFRQGQIEHHGYFINLAEGKVIPLPVPKGK